MSHYKHLVKIERKEISILKKKGYSVDEIALEISRHRSSIYRELRRNTVSGEYLGSKANHRAYVCRKYSKYQSCV